MEMYPSSTEFLPFTFFPGVWVRMARGTRPLNQHWTCSLSAQSVPTHLICVRNTKMYIKSQALHLSGVKLWFLWSLDPNSFLPDVSCLVLESRVWWKICQVHVTMNKATVVGLWSWCQVGHERLGFSSNSSTESSLLLAKILAKDQTRQSVGLKSLLLVWMTPWALGMLSALIERTWMMHQEHGCTNSSVQSHPERYNTGDARKRSLKEISM